MRGCTAAGPLPAGSSEIEDHQDQYVLEVPIDERDVGGVERSEVYRVAVRSDGEAEGSSDKKALLKTTAGNVSLGTKSVMDYLSKSAVNVYRRSSRQVRRAMVLRR